MCTAKTWSFDGLRATDGPLAAGPPEVAGAELDCVERLSFPHPWPHFHP